MGLLAVIGPSRKDHLGLPRFFSTSLWKQLSRSHKLRIRRSSSGKLMLANDVSLERLRANLSIHNKAPLFLDVGGLFIYFGK